jgi:peptidoglycan hydrolase-like protein with peptidoglycan-binding domain
MNAAVDHGFRSGTRIFFAVDFDAQDGEVTAAVLPYFKGIQDSVADAGNQFKIGVYGARNICSRVAAAGHSTASFVSDMSSGFSGNYGYSLPADWAYDQIVTRTLGSGTAQIQFDVDIASGRDTGQNVFDPPRAAGPDKALATSLQTALAYDINRYMESIGYPENGGVRNFTHQFCFNQTVVEQDAVVTEMSNRHYMRKAMIQTSAYWESRHRDAVDDAVDLRVQAYHNGIPGGVRDSSTGIAQMSGTVAILAWNHAIARGYETGTTTDPDNDTDLYAMWNKVRDDNAFAMRSVAVIHLWGADGKPGGSNPPNGETDMRQMALDYNDREVFEIIRRYQGWGDEAVADGGKRMPLYYIFEKYNAIARTL